MTDPMLTPALLVLAGRHRVVDVDNLLEVRKPAATRRSGTALVTEVVSPAFMSERN